MPPRSLPILFIAASRIGDAVLQSGLLKYLVDAHPEARFTIVAGPLAAPLFADTPRLERLIALEKEKGGLHWGRLWRQVRGRRWGLVVDMRGSGLARFVSARRRAVRRPPPLGFTEHKVIEAARLLRLEADPPPPFLFTSAETEARAARLLEPGADPILAVAPAANWAGKAWPSERFAMVVAKLIAPNSPLADARLLILGGSADRWAAEPLTRGFPRDRLIDAVGRIDLLTAYAGLNRVRLFIGNDSGLMHLAAAAGAPTLGLFGPSDERLYGPWGPNARAVRGPHDFAHFKHIDPELNQAVGHMADLAVERVTAAARQLLAETAPSPGRALRRSDRLDAAAYSAHPPESGNRGVAEPAAIEDERLSPRFRGGKRNGGD